MKNIDLRQLGIPKKSMRSANRTIGLAVRDGVLNTFNIKDFVRQIVSSPESFLDEERFVELAQSISNNQQSIYVPREEPAPHKQWGTDLDEGSQEQIKNACSLPISVRAALMPDAHSGYGLPIGGVLATDDAVIPYAVGVDIACRMKMTVVDFPIRGLQDAFLKNVLERETRFGIAAAFVGKEVRDHDVMYEDWGVTSVTKQHQDTARAQLGSSGGGNHFVEFGTFTPDDDSLGLVSGETYLTLLSHSGSRGVGANVARYYSNVAMELHPELPKELKHLAWLDLSSADGQEYWAAMQLMGRYAEANHACIHSYIHQALGCNVLLDIENHHNFAWIEKHDGEKVVVHRKGATPAGDGVLGIIPGSMATPAYVVRGKGNADSMNSASHGAGRKMSRTEARNKFTKSAAKEYLRRQGVTLISGGLDECPMAYKDIKEVMAAQTDLVDSVGEFMPKLVKMAPDTEKRDRKRKARKYKKSLRDHKD